MKATKEQRLRQADSGMWERRAEKPPFPPSSSSGWQVADCAPVSAQQLKPETVDTREALSQSEFLQHVSDMLEVVSKEWERQWLRQRTKSAFDIITDIVRVTTKLFGEDVRVYESCDPEFPAHKWVVFAVEPIMEISELLRAEREWVRAMAQIAPECDMARLLIRPR
jgi:hypothetical protein